MTKDPTKPQRRTYLGSGDAIDIFNGNWRQLWAIKTGREDPPDLSDEFKVQLGIFTEDFHLDWTIERMLAAGEIAREGTRQEFTRPKQPDFVAASLDATVWLPDDRLIPVEAKHTGGRKSVEEVTQFYMPQLQHQLWCAEADLIVISIIMANEEPVRVWVSRSEEWLKVYGAAAANFWRYVTEDREPPKSSPGVDMPQKARDGVKVNGKVRRCVDQDNYFIDRAHTLIENEAAAKSYEGAKKDLKAMMGPEDAELYSEILTLKRDARGAVRFTTHKKQDREAA